MTINNKTTPVAEKNAATDDRDTGSRRRPFLEKCRNIAMPIMLLMISIGQWSDTKDVLFMAYHEVVSRWTNTLEYDKLAQLRIGYASKYVDSLLGVPQLIKHSTLSPKTTFSYYETPKYILTTAITDKRLSGFSVVALQADFYAPIVYFNKSLNRNIFAGYIPSQGLFDTDFGNIEYFIERYELNRNLMFYNFSLGVINYGLMQDSLRNKIKMLNRQFDMGEDALSIQQSIQAEALPNYYSISEISTEIMQESLLSRYEMAALFKSH